MFPEGDSLRATTYLHIYCDATLVSFAPMRTALWILWTMRLRRNASLAVENPAGFPTARSFAHKPHSGSYQCFKKPGNNPELSTRVGNFQ